MEDTGKQQGQSNIFSAYGQTEASVKVEPNLPRMWSVKV